MELRPEPPLILLRPLVPGAADRLARESTAEHVNGIEAVIAACAPASGMTFNPVCGGESVHLSDISIAGDVGPVLREDSLTELVLFTEPGGVHAGAFEPEIEPSD